MKKSYGMIAIVALLLVTLSISVLATEPEATVVAVVQAASYPVITLEAGKEATINFQVTQENLNGCNNEIIIPDFAIDQRLAVGDNFVTIKPEKTGTYAYMCWMGMIRSTIHVVEAGSETVGVAELLPNAAGDQPAFVCPMMSGDGSSVGSCCGR